LGTEKRSNKYTFAATAYYMLYKNQLVLTGKINDVGAYTRENVPTVIEWALSYKVAM
jgi:iron complex outermembrane receptor protein